MYVFYPFQCLSKQSVCNDKRIWTGENLKTWQLFWKISLFFFWWDGCYSWDKCPVWSRCVVDVISFRVDEITSGDIKFPALLKAKAAQLTEGGRYQISHQFFPPTDKHSSTSTQSLHSGWVYENETDSWRTFCCDQVIYGNLGNFCVRRKSDLLPHPSLHWRRSVLRSLRGRRREGWL